MSNVIQLKYRHGDSNAPTTSDLTVTGELAVNTTDGLLYTRTGASPATITKVGGVASAMYGATKGGLLVADGSGLPSILAIGQDDYVLTADDDEGTGMKWAAAGGAGDGTVVAAANSESEDQYIAFIDNANGTAQSILYDTPLTYNPGSNTLKADNIVGLTAILPDAAGGADLGSTSFEWGDIYIYDDKKIMFGDAQDVSIEYDEDGTDTLLITGATTIAGDMTMTGTFTLGAGSDEFTIAESSDNITMTVTPDDKDLIIQSDNGSGGVTPYITLDGSAASTIMHKGTNFENIITMKDDKQFRWGNGNDVQMEYDEDGTDSLLITGAVTFADGSTNVNFASHDGTNGLALAGTVVTSSAAELNTLDGYTGSVTELNYLDTLHATGVTNTEFDYLDGVTSAIQTQLDAALPKAGGQMTGNITFSGSQTVDGRDISADGAVLDTCFNTQAEVEAIGIREVGALTVGSIDEGFGTCLSTSMKIGRDADNDIDFTTDNNIIFRAAGADQIVLKDGILEPVTNNDIDLGSSSKEFNDLYLGGDLITTDSVFTIQTQIIEFGDGTDANINMRFNSNSASGHLWWMEDEDYFKFSDHVTMDSTSRLNFGDTGTYIFQSADGVLDLVADSEIELNATTIDINGAVDVSGALTVAGAATLNGSAHLGDNDYLYFGADNDYSLGYVSGNYLAFSQSVNSSPFGIIFKADSGGDDAGDEWRMDLADGGVMSWGNDIASAGTYVTHYSVTPNSTVANSTFAIAGHATVGHDLTVSGDLAVTGSYGLVAGDIPDISNTYSAKAGNTSLTTVGTIGTGTWNGSVIAHAYIGNDAIEGDNIADDAVDTEHIADDAIEEEQIGAGEVKTAAIADNAVTLAKMAGLDRGHIIYGDTSGNPASLANSTTDGHVLTVQNANGDIGWEAASGGGGSSRSVAGDTDNGIITWVTSDNTFAAEANMTFSGSDLTVAGDVATTTVTSASTITSGGNLLVTDGKMLINKASGDPQIDFTINDAAKWVVGVDDSQSDQFAINSGSTLADASDFELDSSGNVTILGNYTDSAGGLPSTVAMNMNAVIHGLDVSISSFSLMVAYPGGGPSDEALKTNFTDYNYGLNEIKQLNPKFYSFKESEWETTTLQQPTDDQKSAFYAEEHFGLTAQNVESVMPKAVKALEKDSNYKGYDKDALIFALINAVKELEARVVTLEG